MFYIIVEVDPFEDELYFQSSVVKFTDFSKAIEKATELTTQTKKFGVMKLDSVIETVTIVQKQVKFISQD